MAARPISRAEAGVPRTRRSGGPYEALERAPTPLTRRAVAASARLSPAATAAALLTLAAYDLAERDQTGWRRGPASLQVVAEILGVDEVLHRLRQHALLVRRLEIGEEPPEVDIDPGVTSIVLVTPVRYTAISFTDQVGRQDDLITWMRVVEVRRDGNRVFGRTLRPDEEDSGQAILLRPGDSLTFEEGAIKVSLKAIDALESSGAEGYSPVTGVLWSWMSIAPPAHEGGYRYVLSAARRLDAAQRLLAEVAELLTNGVAGSWPHLARTSVGARRDGGDCGGGLWSSARHG